MRRKLKLTEENRKALAEALERLVAPGITLKLKVHKRTYTCAVDASEKRLGFVNKAAMPMRMKGISIK